jgi:hypothetical protein
MPTAGDSRRLIADLGLDHHVEQAVAAAPSLPADARSVLAGCQIPRPTTGARSAA